MLKEKMEHQMKEYFNHPEKDEGKLRREVTNVRELMESPDLPQTDRLAIRPVLESSELKLLNVTIQSQSSIRSKSSRVVPHHQQHKDYLPYGK